MATAKPTPDKTTPTPEPPAAPAKASGKRKVSEWEKLKFPKLTLKHSEQNHKDAWKHAAAGALHCWPEHLYHAGKEMELTEADYDKAIEAAITIKPGKPGTVKRVNGERKIVGAVLTTYKPHKPALSPHNDVGIKNVKPD